MPSWSAPTSADRRRGATSTRAVPGSGEPGVPSLLHLPAATLAGIFTNTVFGIIIAYSFIALWEQRPHLGGYGQAQALTFVWVAQALIMPVGLFIGGVVDELTERVRSGAVAVDLHRPYPCCGGGSPRTPAVLRTTS